MHRIVGSGGSGNRGGRCGSPGARAVWRLSSRGTSLIRANAPSRCPGGGDRDHAVDWHRSLWSVLDSIGTARHGSGTRLGPRPETVPPLRYPATEWAGRHPGLPAGGDGAAAGGGRRNGILMRFQLIRPISTRTTDKAIAAVDSALRNLFQWNGYRLRTQAAMTVDAPRPDGPRTFTSQKLQGDDGQMYGLDVSITNVTSQKATLSVSLTGYLPPPASASGTEQPVLMRFNTSLTTTVTVSFGHTVVLGPRRRVHRRRVMPGNGTLILVVEAGVAGGDSSRRDGGRPPVAFSETRAPRPHRSR